MTYPSAAAVLGTRERKKVGNNTWLVRREVDAIALRLHATDVLTYFADGRTVLRSGGWQTYTTKDRLNRFGDGFHVLQRSFAWTVSTRIGEFTFRDGMTVHDDGRVCVNAPCAVCITGRAA